MGILITDTGVYGPGMWESTEGEGGGLCLSVWRTNAGGLFRCFGSHGVHGWRCLVEETLTFSGEEGFDLFAEVGGQERQSTIADVRARLREPVWSKYSNAPRSAVCTFRKAA